MENSITYIHSKKASFKSWLIQKVLWATNRKKKLVKAFEQNKFQHRPARLPESLSSKYQIEITQKDERNIWTIQHKNQTPDKVVFYLHGGAYVANVYPQHWDFIEALLERSNVRVVVPDYPLAPTYNFRDAYLFVQELYQTLLEKYQASNIIFMGDSAGAGLALGLAQKLRDEKQSQPSQIILLAPWLDLTMSNPDIGPVVKKDQMLSKKGLEMAAKAYASGEDMKNYMLSPIYGNFEELPRLSIFIGTHDLFIADARKLQKALSEQGINHHYYEYPKMPHVWMVIVSLKEAQDAIDQIAKLLAN